MFILSSAKGMSISAIDKMKSWHFENLTCSSCAGKIEEKVRKLDVGQVNMNTLTMEIRIEKPLKNMQEILQKIVDETEPGVKVRGEASKKSRSPLLIRVGIGAFLFAISQLVASPQPIQLLAYAILSYDILYKSVHNLFRGQLLDEYFLMSVATLGAIALKDYPEALAVMLFYQIGEYLQERALTRSQKSIEALLELRPDQVRVRREGRWIDLAPEELLIGDLIRVLPGERLAVDSVVYEGESQVDTSAITGESRPSRVGYQDPVYSGSINLDSSMDLVVKKEYNDSTLARILALVQDAGFKKAPVERFITRFSKIYTPVVVGVAILLAIIPTLMGLEGDWIRRALIFLVISCPCGFVISVPLSFYAGIGKASSQGILIKGGTDLETLSKLQGIVFDKTGTLTKGEFTLQEVKTNYISRRELIKIAASLESRSTHPIARSIVNAHDGNIYQFDKYVEIRGKGIEGFRRQERYLIGSGNFLEEEGIKIDQDQPGLIHISRGDEYLGWLELGDKLRDDTSELMQGLKKLGLRKIMLSGDKDEITQALAKEIGIDDAYGELLPEDKVRIYEELRKTLSPLAFVGDGINDAPVLARSDLGIAMGGLGSDAALEAADMVLMEDKPIKILRGIEISKKTMRHLWQNIIFIFSVKLIVLALGALGLASMWMAVFADVGVTLIAILNSLR
ncbi:MAG TPA: heavy metal translocating P-type ATPase, partial [Clostridia bacterium]|nr:heavy metal translocating P-type ATPase [Clostridia bacterium]